MLAALRESAVKTGPRRTGFAFESELLIDAARRGTPIGAVAIPALYGFHGQRASHTRPGTRQLHGAGRNGTAVDRAPLRANR